MPQKGMKDRGRRLPEQLVGTGTEGKPQGGPGTTVGHPLRCPHGSDSAPAGGWVILFCSVDFILNHFYSHTIQRSLGQQVLPGHLPSLFAALKPDCPKPFFLLGGNTALPRHPRWMPPSSGFFLLPLCDEGSQWLHLGACGNQDWDSHCSGESSAPGKLPALQEKGE